MAKLFHVEHLDDVNIRPVTPEAAGSSPVDPANKLSIPEIRGGGDSHHELPRHPNRHTFCYPFEGGGLPTGVVASWSTVRRNFSLK